MQVPEWVSIENTASLDVKKQSHYAPKAFEISRLLIDQSLEAARELLDKSSQSESYRSVLGEGLGSFTHSFLPRITLMSVDLRPL
jgi:hypothetical protein